MREGLTWFLLSAETVPSGWATRLDSGCANSPERRDVSKVSELLSKGTDKCWGEVSACWQCFFFFFLWYVLLQLQVQIGWIYYATACLWQFLLQTGSKLALLITHCFPFLLERIAVQTTTTLWALSTWFCSGFRKSIPWFGWTKMLLKPVCCQSWTGVQHGGVLN